MARRCCTWLQCLVLIFAVGGSCVRADLPVHCLHSDVAGVWVLHLTPANYTAGVACGTRMQFDRRYKVTLTDPDVALDEAGQRGFWTMVYDEGFEIVIGGNKYFAFSKYGVGAHAGNSYCDHTMVGWFHDVEGQHWGCYYGKRTRPLRPRAVPRQDGGFALQPPSLMALQTLPAQTAPPQTSFGQLLSAAASATHHLRASAGKWGLPEAFDWRDVGGVDYTSHSPVRRQGLCGACFAIATLAMAEIRLRIWSGGRHSVVLSVQDALGCSQYSQACNGGFPYLVGKYLEDYGVVEDACLPYTGLNQCGIPTPGTPRSSAAAVQCAPGSAPAAGTESDDDLVGLSLVLGDSEQQAPPAPPPVAQGGAAPRASARKLRFTRYRYVGGYYGACTEHAMMEEIFRGGPVVATLFSDRDLMYYMGGVLSSPLPPNQKQDGWEPTNHSVLITGWGVDARTGEKYWVCRNSWGRHWGASGYFLLRRGTDERGVESMAVAVDPVLPER